MPQLLRRVLRTLPFSWPSEVVRRVRASIAERGSASDRARFNTVKWTPELLKRLEWRRFEETCAAYFETLGFATRITPSRTGGGVDIGLCTSGSGTVSILVQCKPWDAYRVGIKPLRELRAAMTAAGIGEGVLATSSRFTQEAVTFAAKEHIDLIDGAGLLGKLADLLPEKSLALLKLATQGDFLTPTCPACGIKMISRTSTDGGRKYWGCLNYPRCKQTFFGSVPV
jgi:restriction system protein